MGAVARIAGCLCINLAAISLLNAQVVSGIGSGGNIPANAPTASSGTFTSTAVMNGGGTVATGNAVTVTLIGLQHNWSGDLIATLSYLNAQGNVVVSANLFYRIGQSTNQTEGSWVAFGAPGPTGDNYIFNTDAPGNIWNVAAVLGYADVIPGLQTDTVNNGQYFTSDSGGAKNNLSYAFAGLDISSGTWQLTITDASSHSAEGNSVSNTGSLVGWQVAIQTTSGPKNFSISLAPASQAIVAGSTAAYTVTLSPINGFSGPVTLSAGGLPAGASATFTSNPISVSNSAATTTVTVSTTSGVPAATYTFNVTGQSGSVGHSASASLAVSPAPNSITVNPSSGSGASQTFSFAYTSANQSQEHFFFNSSLTGVGACYLLYEQSANSLYIVNDQGTALSGPVTPGSSGTLSNSQCSVAGSAVSVSVSGNTVKISAGITFSASFAGTKNIYANIVDNSNNEGTWQQIGTWTVPGGVANSISVNPSSGSGATQTFAFTYTNANQSQEHFFFNSSLTGVGACYLLYEQSSNALYIVNDQGTALSGPVTPGGSGTLSNSQCSVPASTASVSVSGNTVNISVAITFSASFAGAKDIYANTVNNSGVEGTWQQIGTWTVPGGVANSISVNPSSGSGATQTFAFTYTNANQSQEHFFFNSSLTGVGACYLLYDRPSNSLYIVNDQGTAIGQPFTPGGSGTLSNSQCSAPASTASVSVSGNTVIITVTITFSSSFGGAQNIYANIVNNSNVEGTWQQIGTWTVPGGVTNSITVTPSSGSGATQAFSFAYTNTNQSQEHFFFNSSLTGVGACYILYERSPNALYMVNDQGTALIGPVTPGGSGTLSNSQCSVPASSALVSTSGATVTVNVTITFTPAFTGAKNIYATIVNNSNVEGTWQQLGSWTP